jgi:hypothetical protein
MTDHDVIEELREKLRVALDRVVTLERELEARRRAERDERLSSAFNRPKRRPPVKKPSRPRVTDLGQMSSTWRFESLDSAGSITTSCELPVGSAYETLRGNKDPWVIKI